MNQINAIFGGDGLSIRGTPLKIDIEREHDCLEDEFPFPGVYCQVPCSYTKVYII